MNLIEEFIKKSPRRIILVFLWLLLSICSIQGWKYLTISLAPDEPRLYVSHYGAELIAGSWYLFAAVVVALTILYFYELKYCKKEKLYKLIMWILIYCIAAVFIYPIGSNDFLDYVGFTRLNAYYGLNPYQDTVINISNYLTDPFLKNMWWVEVGTPYGPIWTWTSHVIYNLLSKFGLIPLLFGYKIFGLIMHIIITMIIYRLSEIVAEGSGLKAALLYGMNPLAIFELVVSAHNDGLAIVFLLTSILLLIQTKYFKAFIVAGISAACKLTVGIAILFMYWKTAKEKGIWYARLFSIMAALLVAVMYFSFLDGSFGGLFSGVRNPLQGIISNSLVSIPYALGLYNLIVPVRIIGLLIFGFIYILLLRKSQDANNEKLITLIGLGFVVYYLFGAYVVLRWYFLWPLAVMAIIPNNLWTKAIVGQSVLMLISYNLYLIFGEGEISNAFTYLFIWIPIIYIWFKKKSIDQDNML